MPKNQPTPISEALGGPSIMKDDCVRGVVRQDNLQNPDRYFYLLDPLTDAVWEVDGYRQPAADGEKVEWMLLLKCPACHSDLRLSTAKKQVEITARGLETGEPIGCAWFVDTDGYKGLCPWRAELQPPKKAMLVDAVTRAGRCKVRIDAIVRPAK